LQIFGFGPFLLTLWVCPPSQFLLPC
jgi:hypothetical protein